ncbi:hypothetical protein D8674_035177 [Pyrus ussuriensis x Pyrus communis]|uniref:Uncharacterized protein n=1 Tax=Pyrus ussuriensis x Pyrus communis TaxID=2448454 RepID=A0A5N5GG98_9ROSA|nr:hypothetical protein D8674_035177 [Pyrus ussuriensis x Pyrus communis]
MSEWLRRQTRNLLGFACAGSNPALFAFPSPPTSMGTLHPNPTHFLAPAPTRTTTRVSIPCGPCYNRGPLVKGRVLGIAIQVVQTLKRARRSDAAQFPTLVSKALSRLIKADLGYLLFIKGSYCSLGGLNSVLPGGGLQRWSCSKGLIRLIRAVIGADRRESTVRIYEMLKRNGWGCGGFKADEYMVKVLSKGLKRLG